MARQSDAGSFDVLGKPIHRSHNYAKNEIMPWSGKKVHGS